MADENEDQWLYGDSNDNQPAENYTEETRNDCEEQPQENDQPDYQSNEDNPLDVSEETAELPEPESAEPEGSPKLEAQPEKDAEEAEENGSKDQDEDPSDSDSDDDVHVVIGDIKSTPAAYNSLNIKRGALGISSTGDNLKKQTGKFSIDDFETIGVISGMPAHEFNLDQLEDKPWRQPGADITDYFNYGFNEETWRAYCERQKRMRSESGVGLILNAGGGPGGGPPGGPRAPQVTVSNDAGKYSSLIGPKRAGPPPGRKMGGTIDVIGSSGLASRRNLDKSPPKENVIQVMTADRREYSRKPGFPDMSVPPPAPGIPPTFDMPPPGYPPEPVPFYMPEPDPYYQSYEPTQDSQWGSDPTWQPTNLAIPLTEPEEDKDVGPKTIPTMVPPMTIPPLIVPPAREQRENPRVVPDRERSERRDLNDREIDSVGRERERERERSDREKDSAIRERERDRDSVAKDDDKERDRSRSQYRHKESRHRHRSRSRSRRHKSRSRSPSRRKKKSRRTDRERSKEDSE